MLKLNNLSPAKGSHKKKKRVGRGTSSGHGKTCCRGHKGQKSRSGGGKGIRFEGGQTPLYRRLPKINKFKNYPFRKRYIVVNLSDLNKFAKDSAVKLEDLKGKKDSCLVKVLGSGELKNALTVEANAFSAEAQKKIEALGGKAVKING